MSNSSTSFSVGRALFVGAFVPGSQGTRGISEDIALRLEAFGWKNRITSRRATSVGRLFDMLATAWIERKNYDVAAVDVYSGPAFIWAEAAARMFQSLKKPFVLSLHGGNLPVFAPAHAQRVRKLLGSAAAVTAPSGYLLDAMKPYRNDILLIPNTIDIAKYEYRCRRNARPNLVWLRAFHDTYHPENAVEALSLLLPNFPDMRLTMIGPDKGDGSLQRTQALAEKLNVASRIRFVGNISKESVPFHLTDADVFLNTSRTDNTPVSVIEALACGLCVVSTDVGGIRYLLDDHVNSLLVPVADAGKMATAIERILRTPGMSEKLSANARAKAETFDWHALIARWDTLLRSVSRRPLAAKSEAPHPAAPVNSSKDSVEFSSSVAK